MKNLPPSRTTVLYVSSFAWCLFALWGLAVTGCTDSTPKVGRGERERPILQSADQPASTPKRQEDTCTVDVYVSPADLLRNAREVKEKLILQYEYCKVLYVPKVIIQDDTLRGRSHYVQVWPPIAIKARLLGKRSDTTPYRTVVFVVQKDKEEYVIEEQYVKKVAR